eukprot:CAMPEP_0180794336 /NCGR_PEP_ID=MMETSP1038_2-20121128/55547_1 /TAXON_ID=632150 /ORGANISM="Azadinium spinosum, Strain 3D9" /LENGTH=133 /DNA_ID=CAMNT_0022833053 /DNA_START=500 /DNA_END=901 /DNA_ORIENTATION=+
MTAALEHCWVMLRDVQVVQQVQEHWQVGLGNIVLLQPNREEIASQEALIAPTSEGQDCKGLPCRHTNLPHRAGDPYVALRQRHEVHEVRGAQAHKALHILPIPQEKKEVREGISRLAATGPPRWKGGITLPSC